MNVHSTMLDPRSHLVFDTRQGFEKSTRKEETQYFKLDGPGGQQMRLPGLVHEMRSSRVVGKPSVRARTDLARNGNALLPGCGGTGIPISRSRWWSNAPANGEQARHGQNTWVEGPPGGLMRNKETPDDDPRRRTKSTLSSK